MTPLLFMQPTPAGGVCRGCRSGSMMVMMWSGHMVWSLQACGCHRCRGRSDLVSPVVSKQ